MANLYVEFDEVSKALELYSQCISRCTYEEETKNNFNIKIYSYYNSGLIYYITDQFTLAKKMFEISLEANKKKNNEIDNEISAVIYETLGEVELEYRKYGEALGYLAKALDLRKKFKSNEDKFALKRISFFINFIYDQYNYEEVLLGVSNVNRFFEADRHKARLSSLNQSILSNNNDGYSNNNNIYGKSNVQVMNNFSNPSLLLSNNSNMLLQHQKTNTLLSNNRNNNYSNFNENEKDSFMKNTNNKLNNNNNNNNSDEEDNAFNYNFTNFFKSNMQNLNETYNNLSLKVKPKEIDKPEADMLNPNFPQTLKDEEIEEVEKFFLFVTKLNQEEIEVLNKDQKHFEINLPLNFSDAFKAKLSYSQKIQLLEMKVLKLRRNIILKDPRGKIDVENLNFEILQRKNNSKKKIDNVLNRYANYHNLEKWVENNVSINNFNYNETSKKNTFGNDFYNKREEDSNNQNDNFNLNNTKKFNNQSEKFNNEFNLNHREILIFNDFKSSLINFIRTINNQGYVMLSDEDIVTIIQNSDEDEIKYWIKNPEKVLENNETNELN